MPLSRPLPGDFFVTSDSPVNSTLTGAIFATAIKWGTRSPFNHAGVYVGGGKVVEAQPGGARYGQLSSYQDTNTVWSTGKLPIMDGHGDAVASAATSLIGTPYGWPDILAITLAQKRVGKWQLINAELPDDQQPWWVRRLSRTTRLICSQLVDYACYLAGVHLYDDRRPFGLVSPGDLGRLIGAA